MYWADQADGMYKEKIKAKTSKDSGLTGRLYYRNLWKDEEQLGKMKFGYVGGLFDATRTVVSEQAMHRRLNVFIPHEGLFCISHLFLLIEHDAYDCSSSMSGVPHLSGKLL